MTTRPILLALALLASLICAQAAAAQPITLNVTSARTVTNQPDPVELTGTISLAPSNAGTGTPVTGTGTAFSTELHIGDLIKPYTAPGAVPRWLSVQSIASDTSLRVTQPGAGGGRYNGPAVSGVRFSTLPALKTIAKGDPVTTFKYLVNQEDTDQNSQPASACQPSGVNSSLSSCLWTSIRHLSGSSTAAPGAWNATTGYQGLVPDSSPVVTSGDQSDFAGGHTIDLPPGKYLISFVADGHKIDGAHFTTDGSGATKTIAAQAQPYNLPLATLRIQVFNDNASTNGQWDEGDETYDPQANRAARMPGFTAHLADVLGEITTDWYGNPLCTTYRTTTAPGRTGYELDAQGKPIILVRGGQCVSNVAGEIAIPNLGPDRYATTVLAPAKTVVTPPGLQPTCRNKSWVKTTTLEGGQDWDTWIQEGATGYDTEFVHAGEPTPWTMAGFVCPATSPSAPRVDRRHRHRARAARRSSTGRRRGGVPYNGTVSGGTPERRPTARSSARGSRSPGCRRVTKRPPSCRATPTARSRSATSRRATTWSRSGTTAAGTCSIPTPSRCGGPRHRHRRHHALRLVHRDRRAPSTTTSTRTAAGTPASAGVPGFAGRDQDAASTRSWIRDPASR